VAGTAGLVAAGVVAVILGLHPPGTTELYSDGSDFVEHVGVFWLIIHLVAAVVLLVFPVVIRYAADTRVTAGGRVFGRLAALLSSAGIAIGVLHLVGTDAVTLLAYQDTLAGASDQPAADIGADVLLRLHAATLAAWVVTFFISLPLATAISVWFEGERRWRLWLPALTVACHVAALLLTLIERQWTTVSEMALFRPGAVLFVVWFGLLSRDLRAGAPSRVSVASA
jgi:hypothetical protein